MGTLFSFVTYSPAIPVTFAAGDQFGARAKSNGVVEVYKNGTLVGSVSGVAYANVGGKIGLKMVNASATLLDDFGGGDVVITPTPTPTPEICTGGAAVGGQSGNALLAPNCLPTCVGNQVDVISSVQFQSYPADRVRELTDMGFFSDPAGIKAVESPTLNSRKGGLLSWTVKLQVFARVEFPQTGYAPQVWYQIGNPGASQPVGWLVARYEGQSYVLGDDPCSTVSAPGTLTFNYDRRAAANYAIEHSYDNIARNYNTPGRVNSRLPSNPLNLPYADFYYGTSYLTGQPGNSTGSAMFVSEALWMGGMPMIQGDTANCVSEFTQGTENGNISWRYCYVGGQANPAMQAWDFHKILGTFFTTAQVAEPPVPPDTTRSITTLASTSRGNVIRYTGLLGTDSGIPSGPPLNLYRSDAVISGAKITAQSGVSQAIVNLSDLDNFMLPSGIGAGDVSDELGMATFMRDRLAGLNGQPTLQMGDYLYINPGADPHGLLVVGWGKIADCPVVMATNNRLTISNFALNYNTVINDAAFRTQNNISVVNGVALVVPYVVDYTTAQWPVPRPFYCTRWFTGSQPLISVPPVVSPYFFGVHDWYFYTMSITMPNNITIPTARLWVDPNWFWSDQDRTS